MMKYVKMTAEHVSQIATIEALCFSSPWSEKSIASELENPLAKWIVAVDGDVVAGYIGSQTVMGEADMMNLAVLPQYRQQGIGQGLVEALLSALRQDDVVCLTLEVRISNEPAIRLYSKMGFQQIGRRPNYYVKPKEDALILRKEMDA